MSEQHAGKSPALSLELLEQQLEKLGDHVIEQSEQIQKLTERVNTLTDLQNESDKVLLKYLEGVAKQDEQMKALVAKHDLMYKRLVGITLYVNDAHPGLSKLIAEANAIRSMNGLFQFTNPFLPTDINIPF